MSGHSKWATIKHAKAATDQKRGALFTKLSKEIIVAARMGGGDPEGNFRLRLAVQKARDSNMPVDNINRAIKKGTGEMKDGEVPVEMVYEGYGPGGIAIIVQAVSDNRNRTVSDIRSNFTKRGGSLAESGAVSWQFAQKGVLTADIGSPDKADDMTLTAIDAGADDINAESTTLTVYCPPETMEKVRRSLTEAGATVSSAELSMVPKVMVPMDEKSALSALKLLDILEDLDDVQKVFSNGDFPDSAIEQYRNGN
ncbi:MAG: YebC/PmpR family DNA-binding transcriptional regulator [SAR202 cluster bacterium]|nr:YebC/PmpR family DNA-binding transcriptional regulator [SAR202 cluster bacterium]